LKYKKISKDKLIQVGDVLVNSTGTGTLGRVAQVKKLPSETTVDSHITIIRPIKNIFYNPFFGYALTFIEEEISKRGDGCGGQTELARSTLKNDFVITYPESHTEQQRIVIILDKAFSAIAKAKKNVEKNLTNLEELKKSILQKAFNNE
jgi:type I restriction enzyme S subunit